MGDQETYEITQSFRRLHRDNNFTHRSHRTRYARGISFAGPHYGSRSGQAVPAEGTAQEIAANEAVRARPTGKGPTSVAHRSSRRSHLFHGQEPHSSRHQPRGRGRQDHAAAEAATAPANRQRDQASMVLHARARGANHHLRNQDNEAFTISDRRHGGGLCARRAGGVSSRI